MKQFEKAIVEELDLRCTMSPHDNGAEKGNGAICTKNPDWGWCNTSPNARPNPCKHCTEKNNKAKLLSDFSS